MSYAYDAAMADIRSGFPPPGSRSDDCLVGGQADTVEVESLHKIPKDLNGVGVARFGHGVEILASIDHPASVKLTAGASMKALWAM